jgi:hypothetical protein
VSSKASRALVSPAIMLAFSSAFTSASFTYAF